MLSGPFVIKTDSSRILKLTPISKKSVQRAVGESVVLRVLTFLNRLLLCDIGINRFRGHQTRSTTDSPRARCTEFERFSCGKKLKKFGMNQD